jgi:hypothetical protein
MKKHHREALALAEECGVSHPEIIPGGKHLKIAFEVGGARRTVPLASSPSGNAWKRMVTQQIRRVVQEARA